MPAARAISLGGLFYLEVEGMDETVEVVQL